MSNKTRVSPRRVVMCWGAAAVMGCVTVNSASASLVAYDPFLIGSNRPAGEYTAGADIRTMGTTVLGWVPAVAHAGSTSNFQPNSTGENSPAVSYEAGGRLQWLGATTTFDRQINRQLSATPSSTEWWFSIMVNRLSWANSTANTFAVGGFIDGSGNGLQVGYDDQLVNNFTPDLVVRLGGANRVIETDAPANSSRYVLIKLDINTSGNDTVSVWNNPAVADPLGVADFVWNDVNVSDSLTPFTQSKYQSPGQSGVVYWDEIRLGTDYASVVPEPSSIALVLMGAGGLLALRRRQG